MARQIAGRVHPRAGAAREGVGKEGAGGQVRAPEVAAGEALAADRDLAGDPRRAELARTVQDVGAGARQRPANRELAELAKRARRAVRLAMDGVRGGGDGDLRRPVGVDHPHRGAELTAQARDAFRERPLAAVDEEAEGWRPGGLAGVDPVDQLLPEDGGQVADGHPPARAGAQEGRRPGEHRVVAEDQRRAARQAAEDLIGAGVEGEGGELQHPVGGGEPRSRRVART